MDGLIIIWTGVGWLVGVSKRLPSVEGSYFFAVSKVFRSSFFPKQVARALQGSFRKLQERFWKDFGGFGEGQGPPNEGF